MKPKAFKAIIPVKGFSKHDNAEATAIVLEDRIKALFTSFKAVVGGVLPFDINNITVEPVYDGPDRSFEPPTGVRKTARNRKPGRD